MSERSSPESSERSLPPLCSAADQHSVIEPEHAQALLQILRPLSKRLINGVEIGACRGDTSRVLLEYLPQLNLVMVDAWLPFDPDSPYFKSRDSCARASYEEQQEHRFQAESVTRFAHQRRRILSERSVEAARQVEDTSQDFVFIDADPTYESVKEDINSWWPKVRPGGFLCGHDYGHPRDRRGLWGVSRAVNEFARVAAVEVEKLDFTVWLIRKPVGDRREFRSRATFNPTFASGRLAVVTSYFNPAGYSSIRRNYERFVAGMESLGADLWTVEVAFGDEAFELTASPRVLRLRAPDVMWQKERALNVLIQQLPDQYDRVAWLDCDIIFDTPDWIQKVLKGLNKHAVLQGFSDAHYLRKGSERTSEVRRSLARHVLENHPRMRDLGVSHPGFAWASHRELLRRHGLFDQHVTGSGDSMMAVAYFAWWNHDHVEVRINEPMRAAFRKWAEPVWRDVKGDVGYVDVRVRHLWHGSIANRLYLRRCDYLIGNDFDPAKDITIGDSGLWNWCSDKPTLHQQVQGYFFERDEDG